MKILFGGRGWGADTTGDWITDTEDFKFHEDESNTVGKEVNSLSFFEEEG